MIFIFLVRFPDNTPIFASFESRQVDPRQIENGIVGETIEQGVDVLEGVDAGAVAGESILQREAVLDGLKSFLQGGHGNLSPLQNAERWRCADSDRVDRLRAADFH